MERKIIDVDCSKKKIVTKEFPAAYRFLGGRGLTSTIINEEISPTVHPLDSGNILVFSPGLMAGSTLSCANRLSAGAKSPLTGGIKESNAGGTAAYKLGRLGIGSIILRGKYGEDGFPSIGLRISKDTIEFEDLSFIKEKNSYESSRMLIERYGKKSGLILIGSAGEKRLPTACMNVTDMEGEPCRTFGRGGLGAVLGSKGIKAIIIDDSGCSNPFAGNAEIKGVTKDFAVGLRNHPATGTNFPLYGTVMVLKNVNALGGLPTRNFSEGIFEGAESLGPEKLHDTIKSRGGMTTHACMPGCVIRCSNKYVKPDGSPLVGSLDYETVCLLGSNLGLSDLDQVAELNYYCNDIGIDTIETGVALGVLAEGGVFSFGDFEAIRRIILDIGKAGPLGRLAASGSVACGKAYGVTRIPAVKGQGMAAYDPRAIKGLGVTYAVSPMGADHTAGNSLLLDIDHMDPNVQVDNVRDLHLKTTILDMLGLCFFISRYYLDNTSAIDRMVRAFTNNSLKYEDLYAKAKDLLLSERSFNKRAGIGEESDHVPEFMRREAIDSVKGVFDVPQESINSFYNFD